MLFQTLDIALNGVTNIRHRLVARFPLGNTAGQSRAFGNKNAVFIGFNRDRRDTLSGEWKTGASAAGYSHHSLHIRVRAFTTFGDEMVDPHGDNGQRYGAELEHCIVERADVELRCERFAAFSRTRTIASELATLKT